MRGGDRSQFTPTLLYRAPRRDVRMVAGVGMLVMAAALFVIGLVRERPRASSPKPEAIAAPVSDIASVAIPPAAVAPSVDAPGSALAAPAADASSVVNSGPFAPAEAFAVPALPAPVASAPTAIVGSTPATVARVVQAGDCLWCIAAEILGPDASEADVNAMWQTIFETNRDVIGGNPDVLSVGSILAIPALAA